MDLNMPGPSGAETIGAITARAPLTRVVVLTISSDDEDIVSAVMSGACGYLLKDSSVDQLLAGIRAAAAGRGRSDHGKEQQTGKPAGAQRPRTDPRAHDDAAYSTACAMLAIANTGKGFPRSGTRAAGPLGVDNPRKLPLS
jgi:DNA-binding NarL/FixJ family response regulator